VFVPLYERQVAKPLSICNPDRDAFASRFTDVQAYTFPGGARGRREKEKGARSPPCSPKGAKKQGEKRETTRARKESAGKRETRTNRRGIPIQRSNNGRIRSASQFAPFDRPCSPSVSLALSPSAIVNADRLSVRLSDEISGRCTRVRTLRHPRTSARISAFYSLRIRRFHPRVRSLLARVFVRELKSQDRPARMLASGRCIFLAATRGVECHLRECDDASSRGNASAARTRIPLVEDAASCRFLNNVRSCSSNAVPFARY